MSLNASDCPFCPLTFTTSEERDSHAGSHTSTRKVVDMSLCGVNIALILVDVENSIYKCPGACATRASLGGVFLHVLQEHPNMLTNLKRVRDEADLPVAAGSLTRSPPSTPTLGRTIHIRRSDSYRRRSSYRRSRVPSTNGLPAFPTSVLPAVSTPGTLLRADPPQFTYNVASLINQHPDTNALLDFVATSLSNLVDGCAFHGIMEHSSPGCHHKVYRCTQALISSISSEYKAVFTKALHGQPGTVCYRCWCPMITSFENHPPEICPRGTNLSNRNHWEDWFRVLPYLIFRVAGLRQIVFQELGIDESVFNSDIVSYAAWLTLPVGNGVAEERITNSIVLAATYLSLRMSGGLSLPFGGFKLDASVPSLT